MEETAPYFASSQYLSEAIGRSVEILAPARLAVSKKGGELTEALKAFYKDYNMPTDRRVAKRMFRIVGENCKELPSVFAEVIGKRFGGGQQCRTHLVEVEIARSRLEEDGQ